MLKAVVARMHPCRDREGRIRVGKFFGVVFLSEGLKNRFKTERNIELIEGKSITFDVCIVESIGKKKFDESCERVEILIDGLFSKLKGENEGYRLAKVQYQG